MVTALKKTDNAKNVIKMMKNTQVKAAHLVRK